MNNIESDRHSLQWFPRSRFDRDFPFAFWLAGLWFYLKAFLYVCYLYELGLDPDRMVTAKFAEIIYFGCAFLPAFLLGLGLWNRRTKFALPSILFLVIDTPVLVFHVLRLAQNNFLDSGLTKVLEYGSLGLNFLVLGWLLGYLAESRNRS